MTQTDERSESVREHTQRVGEDLQATAGETGARLRDEVQERAGALANQQRQFWSGEVRTLANAVRAAGDQLNRDHAEGMARQTRSVAEGLDDVADEIRDRDPGDAFHSVEDFARRQPAAVFGASVVAGFFLSRFFKSSSEAVEPRGRARREPVGASREERATRPASASATTSGPAATPGPAPSATPGGPYGPGSGRTL